MPRKWKGKEAMKTEIVMGEDWRKRTTNRMNWSLLIENIMREKWQEEKTEMEIMVNTPLMTVISRKQQQLGVVWP